MQLYHASNTTVQEPIIINRFATLDFGTGFYTTTNESQAREFARKVFERRGKKGSPTLNRYEFDEPTARSQLEFLEFAGPTTGWLDFVVSNRRQGRDPLCTADIIVGPVANDDVFETVALYERDQIDAEYAIARLKVKELFDQFLFCNMKALSFLSFLDAEQVD